MTTAEHDPPVRQPPHDILAEQCTLGGMLLSKDMITEVISIARPDDFYRPAHRVIYEAILELYAAAEPVDAVTVAGFMAGRGQLRVIGGDPVYLHTLIQSVPVAANAPYYAGIVAAKARIRRGIRAGDQITSLFWSAGDEDPSRLESRAQDIIYQLSNALSAGDTYQVLADLLPDTLNHLEAAASRAGDDDGAVKTGIADLDELIGGLHPDQLVIIAARPAVGKSVLAGDFVRHAAIRQRRTSVFFSLEMGRIEVATRLLSAESRVPLHAMRHGRLTDDDWMRLARRMSEMLDAPLWVDDSADVTIADIRARCRKIQQQHGLDLIVVDYLQLMSSSSSRRSESRQQEVSEMSRALKLLAKEFHVPVVALSQLNRGPEQRTDKKPLLSDLRESGSIEQDSDVVILLHREDAYEKESPRAGEADLIVAKQRNGPTATVTCAFQGHYSRFVDMAPA